MGHAILWFDNDLDYLEPYVNALKESSYLVTTVGTLADADRELSKARYDLLILDVMIPTQSEAEEERYPPEVTSRGTATGLVYYRIWRDRLEKAGTAVLLLTVRPDSKVRQMFIDIGGPMSGLSTKLDLRDVNVFMAKVEQLLGSRDPVSSLTKKGQLSWD